MEGFTQVFPCASLYFSARDFISRVRLITWFCKGYSGSINSKKIDNGLAALLLDESNKSNGWISFEKHAAIVMWPRDLNYAIKGNQRQSSMYIWTDRIFLGIFLSFLFLSWGLLRKGLNFFFLSLLYRFLSGCKFNLRLWYLILFIPYTYNCDRII